MRKQMVTLENKAEMLAAQLRQRIGVQRGNILTDDAIFYYARFEVPNPNGLLRLDMTAQVHIQLTDVKNVLTIPLSALGDPVGDNRYKVKLLRNGETREREVTIGARNDTDVEIVKGLEAGDEVVIGEAKPGAAQ